MASFKVHSWSLKRIKLQLPYTVEAFYKDFNNTPCYPTSRHRSVYFFLNNFFLDLTLKLIRLLVPVEI